MKFATATTATLLVGAFALAFDAAAACSTPEWGKCGDANGATCCPGGQYCHPYTPTFYQCQKTPSQCPTQLTSIDLEGNDIGKAQAGTGEECCNACAKEPKCKAYTFVHYNNDGPQCYLKSAAGKQVSKVGAVSGIVSGGAPPSPTPPTPTPTITPAPPTDVCATKPWAPCGDEKKSLCCPTGQYCQPWSPGSYQCMKVPDACPTQLTDIDFPGNDIGKAQAGTTDECCAACSRDSRCKAYTFINFNDNGPQCYLKSSAGDGKGQRKLGAVSGRR